MTATLCAPDGTPVSVLVGETAYPVPSLEAVAAVELEMERLTEQMNEAARPFKTQIEAYAELREDLLARALEANHLEEKTRRGTYALVREERKGARTIDIDRFVRLFPQHLQECASTSIKVTAAEKVLSRDELALVVVPGKVTYGPPKVVLTNPTMPGRER